MLNLLHFLWKNYAFFLFILLELIGLSMVVSSGHQSAVFAYSSNQLGGRAFNSWESIIQYFNLQETNEQLVNENARLRKQIQNSFLNRDQVSFDTISIPDTLAPQDSLRMHQLDSMSPSFDYIAAKVISNTTHKQKNYLMLNKGSQQGVKENMGVIGQNGVVGIVHSISNDFCTVIPIININSRISVKLKKNHELGTLTWDGKDDNFAQLMSIETYIPINVGDSIVTSGFSHIFPEGILLGKIQDYHKIPGDNNYAISVKLSTEFSKLQYVSIARNLYYEEQLLLRAKMEGKE
jgi:rod shape-determining protein MreC